MTKARDTAPASRTRSTRTAPERLSATLALDEPVTHIAGVSAVRSRALAKLGIHTVRDLLTHFPRRYLDLTHLATMASAPIGQDCTVFGVIHEIKLKRPRYNLPIVEITLTDETGALIVSVFHQPWLKDKLSVGERLMCAGKVEFNYGFKRMTNPFLEVAEDEVRPRIVPIHPATEKLTAAQIRNIEETALAMVRPLFDPLPVALRQKRGLVSRGAAFSAIHFPHEMGELAQARRRLAYEELLLLQLFLMTQARERTRDVIPTSHTIDGPRVRALAAALPFELTSEQEAARDALLREMALPAVANHMVLGDVGTGKTVVAAFGLAAAADSAGQGALLAPTEVLARQHERTLGALFDAAGITHALLTGATPKADRERILAAYAQGSLDVLIGTHALLEPDVTAANLTFVVIDEQQRFGVNQRARMLEKGSAVDALYLTATPIPRTLALTLFGGLTLSYITQRPHTEANRRTVVLGADQRGQAFDGAQEALARGEQVYVVCPLIGVGASERDEASPNHQANDAAPEPYHPQVAIETEGDFARENLAAAEQEAAFLRKRVFVGSEVGLLHGGMAPDEKAAVMARFSAGEIGVLVATTVIEVGVDVPNATVMIVEDADRFGLAQLHQLRGRVGRGDKDATVYFISASKRPAALARLAALERSDDGFEIARYDLSLRREGDILGNRQSGTSALKLVNVVRDEDLIEAAHADASEMMATDPDLVASDHKALAREMRITFQGEHATTGG